MSIVRFLLLNYSFPLFDLLCHEFGCMHIIYYMLRLTTYIAYANGSAARSDTCIFLTFSPVCRRLPFFPYFRYQFAKIIFRFTFSHSLLSIFFLILGLCVRALFSLFRIMRPSFVRLCSVHNIVNLYWFAAIASQRTFIFVIAAIIVVAGWLLCWVQKLFHSI